MAKPLILGVPDKFHTSKWVYVFALLKWRETSDRITLKTINAEFCVRFGL